VGLKVVSGGQGKGVKEQGPRPFSRRTVILSSSSGFPCPAPSPWFIYLSLRRTRICHGGNEGGGVDEGGGGGRDKSGGGDEEDQQC